MIRAWGFEPGAGQGLASRRAVSMWQQLNAASLPHLLCGPDGRSQMADGHLAQQVTW